MIKLPVIYAHRGVWVEQRDQNTKKSIESARAAGFGVETDFRSINGNLYLAHDPLLLNTGCEVISINFNEVSTAINIKEDGLLSHLSEFIQNNNQLHSFVFDGSIPEMVKARKMNIPHALRMSEFEREVPWRSPYLWIDGFESEWWLDLNNIPKLSKNHFLVFVSPELHGREFQKSWNYLKKLNVLIESNFGICTDRPYEFRDFMNE